MKKSLMALAIMSATAGVAQAQSSVQIYGNLDVGFIKQSDQTLNIGKRAANTLGFKGTEDLGNGLKALFQLEMRYDPDTGTVENRTRPLFQGQSRVGLQGDFGMVRIGRGVTAYQETVGQFEPWRGLPTNFGFYTDLAIAGYTSQPFDSVSLLGTGQSSNRWANAVWYNSPVISGFQLNSTVATKELPANVTVAGAPESDEVPFSVSATYNNGPAALMLGYERNLAESTVWSVGGAFNVLPALKLTALFSRQDQDDTIFPATGNPNETDAWVVGANYTMGPGRILAGYGEKEPDGQVKVKQLSLGYEYSLSKRTYLYVDASRKKNATASNVIAPGINTNRYDVGINHSF